MHIENEIGRVRKSLKVSQAELARRMGMSQQAVSGIELQTGGTRIETLERMAKALGLRLQVAFVLPRGDRCCDFIDRDHCERIHRDDCKIFYPEGQARGLTTENAPTGL